MKNKPVVETYEEIAESYTDAFFEDMTDQKYLDKFASYLTENSKILDLGCGPGQFTKYLMDKGFEVIGIDLSKNMIKIARKRVPYGKFKLMDMKDLKFKDQSYDGVLAAYSLIHIETKKLSSVLQEVHRVLKTNGKVLIITQKGEADQILEEPLKPGLKIFMNFFSEERIANILKENNFEVLEQFVDDQPNTEEVLSSEVIFTFVKKA